MDRNWKSMALGTFMNPMAKSVGKPKSSGARVGRKFHGMKLAPWGIRGFPWMRPYVRGA
jgi:hypothetical protein